MSVCTTTRELCIQATLVIPHLYKSGGKPLLFAYTKPKKDEHNTYQGKAEHNTCCTNRGKLPLTYICSELASLDALDQSLPPEDHATWAKFASSSAIFHLLEQIWSNNICIYIIY